ncbi:MAG: RNA polymerase sigma factor [Microgenomates group bacterium GW2011_GWC1_37_12b]|nr:MAG: RNA polymerase sigma factor [Microgenomates group bacterium GW2011_GWC1_37_12b]
MRYLIVLQYVICRNFRNLQTKNWLKLVELVRNKDRELYSEIIRRYQNKLMRYSRYLINDEDKAADVVQETFIKAFINLNGFDTKKKFSSWLYRISHNEAMNAVKKYHKEAPLDLDFDIPSTDDVEGEFDKKEIVQKAHSCLDLMPIMYSEPLALYYLDEKSYEEISDILRIPIGTVGTRINRARALMKKVCQK